MDTPVSQHKVGEEVFYNTRFMDRPLLRCGKISSMEFDEGYGVWTYIVPFKGEFDLITDKDIL